MSKVFDDGTEISVGFRGVGIRTPVQDRDGSHTASLTVPEGSTLGAWALKQLTTKTDQLISDIDEVFALEAERMDLDAKLSKINAQRTELVHAIYYAVREAYNANLSDYYFSRGSRSFHVTTSWVKEHKKL